MDRHLESPASLGTGWGDAQVLGRLVDSTVTPQYRSALGVGTVWGWGQQPGASLLELGPREAWRADSAVGQKHIVPQRGCAYKNPGVHPGLPEVRVKCAL